MRSQRVSSFFIYDHIWSFIFLENLFFIILFFSCIFISWRLITLQYCSGFCHILNLNSVSWIHSKLKIDQRRNLKEIHKLSSLSSHYDIVPLSSTNEESRHSKITSPPSRVMQTHTITDYETVGRRMFQHSLTCFFKCPGSHVPKSHKRSCEHWGTDGGQQTGMIHCHLKHVSFFRKPLGYVLGAQCQIVKAAAFIG